MADAWGGSWGSSWGVSWGTGAAPTTDLIGRKSRRIRGKPIDIDKWWSERFGKKEVEQAEAQIAERREYIARVERAARVYEAKLPIADEAERRRLKRAIRRVRSIYETLQTEQRKYEQEITRLKQAVNAALLRERAIIDADDEAAIILIMSEL